MRIIQGTKSKLSSVSDLFYPQNLLDDDTQNVLLPYINETQRLLNDVIRLYDNKGQAYILPSFDLGFSYNTGRIAGGFTTGMIVNWDTSVPVVPIDMTIKECSGSIFKLEVESIDFFSYNNIKETLEKLRNNGYKFNFASGNHFISLCCDRFGTYYLVVHSGDDGYRDCEMGIYPSDEVWYSKSVLRAYNYDHSRYINYLIDDAAERFIEIGLSKRTNLALFHNELCEYLIRDAGHIIVANTYQHYGFHSRNTVVLGTGLVLKNELFPVFSKEGLPLVIVKPSEEMWSVIINEEERYIIPHGWGQVIDGVQHLSVCPLENMLKIECTNSCCSQSIGYKSKLSKDLVRIRNLHYYNDFINGKINIEQCWNNNLYMNVIDILYPIASYSEEHKKVKRWIMEA